MNDKCVMVIDESLPLGAIANTAAILGITLGGKLPQFVGENTVDGMGNPHIGIIRTPVPILKANRETIRNLRLQLYEEQYKDLTAVDFTELARSCKSYEEYIDKMSYASQLDYIGLVVCGDKRKVNSLTGSFPLLK